MYFKKESYDALVFLTWTGQLLMVMKSKHISLKNYAKLDERVKILFASARPVRDMLPLLEDFPDTDLIGGNGKFVT